MARYEYGGDEFIFVELSEEMSLEVNFQAMAITEKLRKENHPGIVDICPSNASYMVRFDPDEIHPDTLIEKLKYLEQTVSVNDFEISARIVDVPILFDDPWTNEALMRFRDRHQDPTTTDLEYSARINGFESKEALITAITDSPYLVSMIGFVPGLPWCYQMVPREQQIEVPKYVRPRTFTPERAFDFVKQGARVYLAVAGGINVPQIMGSRSTYTLCGIGGLEGRALQAGDTLEIGSDSKKSPTVGARIEEKFIPTFTKNHEIRVVLGLCSYRLTEESKEPIFAIDWLVTPEANRVGYRFSGERLNFVEREQPFGAGSNPSNVVDLGYPIGSIQVPDGVEPIALLNDAVTGGGYTTIATIISTDLNKMGQIKTNESVRFISVSIDEALAARKLVKNQLEEIKQQLDY